MAAWSKVVARARVALMLWTVAASCTAFGASALPAHDADLIQRGKYLATAGDCVACHTSKDGAAYAGGLQMGTPFGSIATPNITPDKATGIGDWTDDEFYRAMHDGIGRHGEYLYPVMPFPWYTNVSRDDVLAIKAYLFSLPPVHKPRVASHLTFPFSVRSSLAAWRAAFFVAGSASSAHEPAAGVERGAYLVNGLAHCGECHNSRLLAGASRFQKPLQGGAIDGWYAPNITSDVHTGIGAWSEEQLVDYLKTGSAPGKGIAVGPMAETVRSLGQLSNDDLHSIAVYLKSTASAAPANVDGPSASAAPHVDRDAPGAQAYLNYCGSCHGVDGGGEVGVVPSLRGNGAVLAEGPQNVIEVMLGGLPAQQTYAPMLAIGAGMTDREVADVANYVRRSWGNHATELASASMVYERRSKIDTVMNVGAASGCPTIAPAPLASAIADPRRGIASRIGATNEANMPQQVQQIVMRTHAAAPSLATADVVNGLTAAYCQVVHGDARLDAGAKALQLGHFSELVYAQLGSNRIAKHMR